MATRNIEPTRWYDLIGDVYEYHGLIAPEGHSSRSGNKHSDNGWRLRERSKPYGSFKNELLETLEKRPCPKILERPGLYQLRDEDRPCIYVGMSAVDIHERMWKYGPKLSGDTDDNKGVNDTENWESYRNMRARRGYTNLNDIQVRFFFMDGATKEEIDNEETYLLGQVTQKYGFPICNGTRKYRIDPKDI